LRRTSFQRKMLATELFVRHGKKYSGKAHKAPYLYSFSKSAKKKS
jgi:8-oxo-dGTP diphosphatase